MHFSKQHLGHIFPSRTTVSELCECFGLDLAVLLLVPLLNSVVSLFILWVELDDTTVSNVKTFPTIVRDPGTFNCDDTALNILRVFAFFDVSIICNGDGQYVYVNSKLRNLDPIMP